MRLPLAVSAAFVLSLAAAMLDAAPPVATSSSATFSVVKTTPAPPPKPILPPSNPWASDTWSPRPGATNDAKDAPIAALCGGGVDASLETVASELAPSLALIGELPDAQEIEWRQRKAGNPQVWPRTWGARIEGGALDRTALAKDVKSWLGASAAHARCGVATYKSGTGANVKEALAVIAVVPVAELATMPTKAKVGQWIDVDATLTGGGTNARVILLPPSGAPKTIVSSTNAANPPHVTSRFLLGATGRHVVQILADDGNGPRPVVEAEIYAGEDPPLTPPSSEVPGEKDGDGESDPATALLKRLNGARSAEGLGKLTIDTTLANVAKDHADAMMKAHLLGHDVGDGDPGARVAATGTTWKVLGENVAKAKTERAAHRALYASPSHRANMLDARFKKIGIAVAIDAKTGDLWVAQMYGS